jgi:ubiquinone/menaquinone biosynthesis C-methylase UbiE
MDLKTIGTYDKMAEVYKNETSTFWERFPRTFLDKFIELSGERILDVGSGPGRDGLLLQKSGKYVVCLDASKEMTRISGERGLDSIVGDFNSLPFKDSAFDAVWSFMSLLHLSKDSIDTALDEIHRVLLPCGVFGLGLKEGEGEEYRESLGESMPRLYSYYKKDEVLDLMERHGFELLYFESFKPEPRRYLNFVLKKK